MEVGEIDAGVCVGDGMVGHVWWNQQTVSC